MLHSIFLRPAPLRECEKRRKLGELLRLQGELEDQIKQLEEDLVKQQAAAAADPTLAGITYGVFAQQVIERRENLQDSINQMEIVIGYAQDELSEAYQELKKYESKDTLAPPPSDYFL